MATGTRMTAEERRESVLLAAVAEFARTGLDGTSTEVIATRAGISQPYLFRLFPTKKALFIAAVERGFERVRLAFDAAAQGLTGDEALRAMARVYSELLGDRDLLLLQMQAYAGCDDEEVKTATRAAFARLWQHIEQVSGVGPERMREFMAIGMLWNVVTAIDLAAVSEQWAALCDPSPA